MNLLFVILHNGIAYFLSGLVYLIFGLPTLLLIIGLPEKRRYCSRLLFWLTHQFYYWHLKATLVPIKFVGLHHIPHKKSVIFAANHQSSLDIPLVGVLAKKHPHVWLAWSALVRRPLLGFVLRRIAVLVDTTTIQRATRSLIQAINRIKENDHHAIIFPEGSRFADGKVHDFFSGFVILARRTGRPVIPIFIRDACVVYHPSSWLVRWHRIKVIVGQPFSIYNDESDEAFKQRVYASFVAQQEK